MASGAGAGADPSARAGGVPLGAPPALSSPAFTLELLVSALRGTDVTSWRLLSRVHVALLRLLLEDKCKTLDAAKADKRKGERKGGDRGDGEGEDEGEGGAAAGGERPERVAKTQQVRRCS